MPLLRLLRVALALIALGLALAAARLLTGLGAPDEPSGPPAPLVTLSVEPEAVAAGGEARLFIEIRNGGSTPVRIVDPADDLFLLFDSPGRLVVAQHFPEEILKDPATNRFAGNGGIPATRRLEPGDEIAKTLRLRPRPGPAGRREVVFALGFGEAEPPAERPGDRAAGPARRVEAFTVWQRRAESAPATIEFR